MATIVIEDSGAVRSCIVRNVGTQPDNHGGTGIEIETVNGDVPVTLLIPPETIQEITEAAGRMTIRPRATDFPA